MSTIRDSYLEAAASATTLLRDPAVAAVWDGHSVLKEFSIRGLAGHLGSQIIHVSRLLEAAAPDDEPLSVVEFYTSMEAFHTDADGETNVRIRRNGEDATTSGPRTWAREVESALTQQRARLSAEQGDRLVSFSARTLLLDDFLLTRMMEIVVHCDDLAVSADIPTPDFPPHVFEPVLDALSRFAVARHGQLAVLRGLSRTERAPTTISAI